MRRKGSRVMRVKMKTVSSSASKTSVCVTENTMRSRWRKGKHEVMTRRRRSDVGDFRTQSSIGGGGANDNGDTDTEAGTNDSITSTATRTAADAVNRGLLAFKSGKYETAAELFSSVIESSSSNDTEMRAGLYNLACAYAKLGRNSEACECLRRAVNDYKLRLIVALEDEDLASLRETREFDELQSSLIGGGGSEEMNLRLRNEAKNPFRFARLTVLTGLGLSALIGLLIIVSRLVAVVTRGEEASGIQLSETVRNFGINTVAVIAIAALLRVDLDRRNAEMDRLRQEDDIGKLLVNLGSGGAASRRIVPLSRLRSTTRPVLVVGAQKYVDDVVRQAEKWKTELRARGVVIVPFVRSSAVGSSDGGGGGGGARGFSAGLLRKQLQKEGLVAGESGDGDGMVMQSEKRWKCEPVQIDDWEKWTVSMMNVNNKDKGDNDNNKYMNNNNNNVDENMFDAKINDAYCLYAQLQLDGSVRTSGNGMPPFKQWLDDIPEMDDVRTRLTGE